MADYDAARLAYKKGDQRTALQEFQRSAELGHADAQFNVGAMYVQGTGTTPDVATGFAWLYLAAENGVADARPKLEQLKNRLAPADLKTIETLRARFGKAALLQTLLPTPEELAYIDGQPAPEPPPDVLVSGVGINPSLGTGSCRVEAYNIRQKAQIPIKQLGDFNRTVSGLGIVVVYADVGADGAVRDMENVFMYPAGPFMRETFKCFQSRKSRPTGEPGAAVRTVKMLSVAVAGDRESPEAAVKRIGTRLLPCAADGSPTCQEMVALMPFSDAERGASAHDMLLRAAQGGLASSQYQYGRYLFAFHAKVVHAKARRWLELALNGGDQRAGTALARLAITDSSTPDWQEAKRSLQIARSRGDLHAALPLAALLAASPDADVRSPTEALEMLEQIRRLRGESEPTTLELEAAADAANGSFDSAVKAEQSAIEAATKLGWSTALLEKRLASYTAGQPWFGDLLAF